ncbi:hypothetical protein PMAYCL1PPCAC_16577 [Pristionchus mayeri]|uniref:Nuclear receptor n=1 Tax=Pristionchus mayeri TaxID=1317129 RepID=A0AAN5CL00_9BILA|nr:hypothetical protein PMAYCL1PPCAC_16577 [Pristionchus mayeri]
MEPINQNNPIDKCRKCLICDGKSNAARMGLDMCRACATFYKRATGKKFYECLSGTNKCALNKGDACKKCRKDKIDKLLSNMSDTGKPKVSNPSSTASTESDPVPLRDAHDTPCDPSCSNIDAGASNSALILNRVRSAYKNMSHTRLTTELLTRPSIIHPMLITDEDCPFEQATAGTIEAVNRILISTIPVFARLAFPEFGSLSKQHQWMIAKKFFIRFRFYEASYRADKLFPEEPDRLCAGYTYWFTHHYDEGFYKDCPNVIDVQHVKTSMHQFCKEHHGRFKGFMKRLKMSEPEFLYITALMFWTLEDLELPNYVTEIGDGYRASIMREMHAYFLEERKMENYAARLGELLTAIQTFDMTEARMKQNLEFMRLMNVLSDDSFIYQIQREDAPPRNFVLL